MTVTAATWCLASPVTQPRNTNFTDSVRYGAALPALPVAPAAKFPFTAAGVGGGVIQDSFNPTNFRGSSDFDIRHNITANGVVELPFGKGKPMLGSAPGWLNQIVGGWQASTLWRFRTGNPLSISNGGIYPTNYLNSALGQLRPGASLPENTAGYNANGNPSIFRTTNTAAGAFMGQYPGTSGTRALIRGAGMSNFDLSLGKFFGLPWEGHRFALKRLTPSTT